MVPLVADAAHNFCVRSRLTRVDRLGDLSRTEPPGSRTVHGDLLSPFPLACASGPLLQEKENSSNR